MPHTLTAAELARRLSSRQISCREVAQSYLNRIAALDGDFGCYLHIDPEETMRWADEAQARIDSGSAGPLAGVPIALKDNMNLCGSRTTCASRILENHVSVYDAHIVEQLRAHRMVYLGKTNLDEFAMGTSTENSGFQLTRNPWDPERSPGGSSGGSAAAVAGGLAPVALGSDTGGSIRQPASLCGVVGFKPTYGRVSRYGLVAFGSSLDQIGPFGRTVEDVALTAHVISGPDARDSTSVPNSQISLEGLKDGSLRGLRFALPREMFGAETQPAVRETVNVAIDRLRSEGVVVDEVELPSVAWGVSTYYLIAPAEASSNLARFDGVRYGPRVDGDGHVDTVAKTRGSLFGHEVKLRIMIGTYALSAGYYDAYYLRAQQVRALMAQDFDRVFQEYDAIVSPTSPVVAFKIGELAHDQMALKLLDFCTIPANMGGYPALSLNCGLAEGLPVGLQLMGPVSADERLLQMSYVVEQVMPAEARRLPLRET